MKINFELINLQDTEIAEPPLTADVPEADTWYLISASGTSTVSGGSVISVSCKLISSKYSLASKFSFGTTNSWRITGSHNTKILKQSQHQNPQALHSLLLQLSGPR